MPRNAVGREGLRAELLIILDHPTFAQCFHNILVNVWVTERIPQERKCAIIKVLQQNESVGLITTITEGFCLLPTQPRFFLTTSNPASN